MDDLRTDDQTINNMNLIKICQHVLKVHFLEGDSRECLGGDEWWILDTVGSRWTEDWKLYYPIPFRKTFWVVDALSHVFKKENQLYAKQLPYSFEANHLSVYSSSNHASTSYSTLLFWFISVEDFTEVEGGFYVDVDE